MMHLWLLPHHRMQIHLQAKSFQQVNHEVVDDVRLIALSDTVQIDGVAGREHQSEPLIGRIERKKFV